MAARVWQGRTHSGMGELYYTYLEQTAMSPSAHIKDVGVRNDLYGAEYPSA
jgi:hypothetical protein